MKHHLQDIVILHGKVSHETAIAEQRKAQILLLLTWNNPEEKGFILANYLNISLPAAQYSHLVTLRGGL